VNPDAPASTASCSAPPPVHPVVLVERTARPCVARVALRGEIDLAARWPLREVRDWLVDQGLTASVDASGVTFMDASGWSAVRQLTPDGSDPLPSSPSPATRHLLALLAEVAEAPSAFARSVGGVRTGVRTLELLDRAEGLLVAEQGWTPDQVQQHLRATAEEDGSTVVDVVREVLERTRRLASG